jgi:hypothetical protein
MKTTVSQGNALGPPGTASFTPLGEAGRYNIQSLVLS